MPRLYTLLFIFLSFFLFLLNPTLVEAKITVTHTPDPATDNVSTITVNITSDEEIFIPGIRYFYNFTHPNAANKSCIDLDRFEFQPTDTRNAVISTRLDSGNKCRMLGDNLFRVFRDKRGHSGSENDLLILSHTISVYQANKLLPSISPLQSPLTIGQTPSVVLANASQGTEYYFWWRDAWRVNGYAARHTAASNNNIIIPLTEAGADFKVSGDKVLCMSPAQYIDSSLGNPSCHFFTSFMFEARVISPTLSCEVVPAVPKKGELVSILGKGLSPSTRYKAGVISDGVDQKLNNSTVSDTNGNVIIRLHDNFGVGSHTAYIYEEATGKEVCPKNFVVSGAGGAAGPINKVPVCKPGDKDCSIANALSCDPASGIVPGTGGVLTAIGCIPTEPVKLVQGILRFTAAAGGGIALLIMVFGAFEMITSAGNPESIKKGQDRFTNAIIGLLLIIFSTLLLQIIGVDILGIPGLGP